MTQEELDALMDGGLEDIDSEPMEDTSENVAEDDLLDGILDEAQESAGEEESSEEIVPPPADEKHKVVAQLDEVTKESEEKASQVIDIMDEISEAVSVASEDLNDVLEFFEHQKELFSKLASKFPQIKTFKDELAKIDEMIEKVKNAIASNEETQDKIMTAMEIMQYQDIHRQKIERVINIMRALIKYMNKLFEGKVDDTQRVKSATHIHGDKSESVTDEDIEALLEQFGV
jgi:ABC-type transporter Mla subunit MlaD